MSKKTNKTQNTGSNMNDYDSMKSNVNDAVGTKKANKKSKNNSFNDCKDCK